MEPGVATTTVPDVLRGHAEGDDGAEFLRLIFAGGEDRMLSYRELVERADGWGELYRARGLRTGDRVLVVLPHSVDLYAAYMGALLGGLVPAMFAFPSPKLSEEQYFANVGQLIERASARLVVTYEELAGKLREREAAALGDALLVTPDHAPERAEPGPAPDVSADAGAFLQYSSGTTGLKKGVLVSHRALLWQVDTYAEAIGATREDRIVSWLPLYHDMGLIACFFLPLLRRIPLVAMSPFDWVARPGLFLRAVSDHRGTLGWLPNFAYSHMAANVPDEDIAGVDLSSLRGLVNCSEPVLDASQRAFLERFSPYGMTAERLAASYAMAEDTFAVTSAGFPGPPLVETVDREAFERDHLAQPAADGRALVSSGRALPDTEIEIVGESGEPLRERSVGQIAVRSPSLMEGYDGNPEATAEAMRDGWFLTGDLGYLAGGELFVTGRAKDLVIVGGRNIYPQDVEDAVQPVDGVVPGRVVAFGVPDERLGTDGLVVVAETERPGDDLRAAIYAAVAGHTEAVPADVELVEPRTLLKSTSGKLSRGANRDAYLERREARRQAPPVATAGGDLAGAVLAAVRRLVRDGGPVGERDSLVRTGRIDSLTLAELFTELESIAGVRLEPGDVDAIDTVEAIVATLRGGGGAAATGAPESAADIPLAYGPVEPRRVRGLWSLYYRLLFRRKGIACGPGLEVLGPVVLQIETPGENLMLGTNVTLMPGAHIKVRDRGRLKLGDGAKLDSGARVVAANDALLELGQDVVLGLGTVVNAGADVLFGRGTFSAAHCVINASDHRMVPGSPMREQGYDHAPILIGEDVWLGAGALVSKGSRIGNGAVVSAASVVSGDVPANAVVQGVPARVVKFRH
ncbi:MAG TPA: AMP-binding protein [Thermoleophilaceae bacterium]|nr:AMP-binding protein [Thermoleophilaceae bacterium]